MTSSSLTADVCAIVVTYNRKVLLRECLDALLAQSFPVTRILVFNNLSTDGTVEMLATEFAPSRYPHIEVVTLATNVGGAGGFEAGVRHAFAAGAEWLWLMDDDTIPRVDALEQLFAARKRFDERNAPDLLASRVVWSDGTLHPMNLQWVKGAPAEEVHRAAAAATAALRASTFVSLLLHRNLVRRHGFPIGSYFLGGDDLEYTARILRHDFGVLVPSSQVLHKTPTPAGTLDAPPKKFCYYVRNTIWILARSNALTTGERLRYAVRFGLSLGTYLVRTRFARQSLGAVVRGLIAGLTAAP